MKFHEQRKIVGPMNNTHKARHTQSGIPWRHALETTVGHYRVHVQRAVARGYLNTMTSSICNINTQF